jgi:hypothetical protein
MASKKDEYTILVTMRKTTTQYDISRASDREMNAPNLHKCRKRRKSAKLWRKRSRTNWGGSPIGSLANG